MPEGQRKTITDSLLSLTQALVGRIRVYEPFKDNTLDVIVPNNYDLLTQVFNKSKFARRNISKPAGDALRAEFHIKQGEIEYSVDGTRSRLEDLGFSRVASDSLRTSGVYGGCIVFFNVDDGGKLDEPIDFKKANRLIEMIIFEPRDAMPVVYSNYHMRCPTYYNITELGKVHKSRLYRFDAEWSPDDTFRDWNYWNQPPIVSMYPSLRRVEINRFNLERFAHRASQQVLHMSGIKELMKSKEGKKNVAKLVDSIKELLDNGGIGVLSHEDKLETVSMGTRGLENFDKVFVDAAVMDGDVPREISTNTTPGGLNSGSNEGAAKFYYDYVVTIRNEQVTPFLIKVLDVLWGCEDVEGGAQPAEYTVEWESLRQESNSEKANREIAEVELELKRVELEQAKRDLEIGEIGELPPIGSGEVEGDFQEDDENNDYEIPDDLVTTKILASELGRGITSQAIISQCRRNKLYCAKFGSRFFVSKSQVTRLFNGLTAKQSTEEPAGEQEGSDS